MSQGTEEVTRRRKQTKRTPAGHCGGFFWFIIDLADAGSNPGSALFSSLVRATPCSVIIVQLKLRFRTDLCLCCSQLSSPPGVDAPTSRRGSLYQILLVLDFLVEKCPNPGILQTDLVNIGLRDISFPIVVVFSTLSLSLSLSPFSFSLCVSSLADRFFVVVLSFARSLTCGTFSESTTEVFICFSCASLNRSLSLVAGFSDT